MRPELTLKGISQAVEGLERREDMGAQSGDSGRQLGHCESSPHVASTPVLLGKMLARWLCRFKRLLKFVYLPQSHQSSHCCCLLSSPWTLISFNFRRLLPSGPFSDFLTLLPFLHTNLLSVVLFPGSPDLSPLLFAISIGHFIRMTLGFEFVFSLASLPSTSHGPLCHDRPFTVPACIVCCAWVWI